MPGGRREAIHGLELDPDRFTSSTFGRVAHEPGSRWGFCFFEPARSRIGSLIDITFANPFLTVARVQREAGLTNQGARNLLRDASQRGWCSELSARGPGGRSYWLATDVWAITEAGPSYLDR